MFEIELSLHVRLRKSFRIYLTNMMTYREDISHDAYESVWYSIM